MFQLQSQNIWMKSTKSLVEKSEKNEKFSFKEELYIFLNNTICHCYRHLAQNDRSFIERLVKIQLEGKVSIELLQVNVGVDSFIRCMFAAIFHDNGLRKLRAEPTDYDTLRHNLSN
jgi:hypothetical protein